MRLPSIFWFKADFRNSDAVVSDSTLGLTVNWIDAFFIVQGSALHQGSSVTTRSDAFSLIGLSWNFDHTDRVGTSSSLSQYEVSTEYCTIIYLPTFKPCRWLTAQDMEVGVWAWPTLATAVSMMMSLRRGY
jgi:hypothetical protein